MPQVNSGFWDSNIGDSRKNDKAFAFQSLPMLLAAGQITSDIHWHFPRHKHDDFCEIFYVSDGEGDFIIDGNYYRAKPGDILIYNSGIFHEEKTDATKLLKAYYCAVGNVSIHNMKKGWILPENMLPIIHAGKYSYKIENYISNLFEECYAKIMGYETICQNLLSLLILLILRIANSQISGTSVQGDDLTLASRIKNYIDKNYTKDITLGEIANNLYVSQYYLSHVFKNEIGYSPINYMINKRISLAKGMLETSNKSIAEISNLVGYDNPSYFNVIFKKLVGMSPGKYREQVRKMSSSPQH